MNNLHLTIWFQLIVIIIILTKWLNYRCDGDKYYLSRTVNLGVMAFPIVPELRSPHEIVECHIQDTCWCGEGLILLQRCSQCILRLQLIVVTFFFFFFFDKAFHFCETISLAFMLDLLLVFFHVSISKLHHLRLLNLSLYQCRV